MEDKDKQRNRLLWTGLIGSVVVALCCLTPPLVTLLGVMGLAALTGYLDYVLIPALGMLLGITVVALYRRQRTAGRHCCTAQSGAPSSPAGTGGRAHD
jgi:mercuric ion transport protein